MMDVKGSGERIVGYRLLNCRGAALLLRVES